MSVDLEAEAAVLGALLLNSTPLPGVIAKGVRPGSFSDQTHRRVFEAVLSLHDRDAPTDHLAVRAELDRLGGVPGLRAEDVGPFVAQLPSAAPVTGNVGHYADIVQRLADWRRRRDASVRLHDAASRQDDEAWAQAEGELAARESSEAGRSYDAAAWQELLLDYFLDEAPPDAVPLPLPYWTRLLDGGLRRGELMVLSGWTSHGKSAMADQILDTAAGHGKRCHLYMTEMGALDRGLRLLARKTGVAHKAMRRKQLAASDLERVRNELALLPYGCTVIGDMTIKDVCRDIRRARWDFAVVDHMHNFEYNDEREMAGISRELARCATASTTDPGGGTAIVAVAQLNDSQMQGRTSPKRPRPGMQSLKAATAIKQDADVVAFVWREDDETGVPTLDGEAFIPKGRSSGVGGTKVRFEPDSLAFVELVAEDAF